jgi:Zn-dependent alcohol dehydrogenase
MKAAVCRSFGQPLVIEEIRIAEPGPGEIKVRLAACAICHSDVTLVEGGWGGELPASLTVSDPVSRICSQEIMSSLR